MRSIRAPGERARPAVPISAVATLWPPPRSGRGRRALDRLILSLYGMPEEGLEPPTRGL